MRRRLRLRGGRRRAAAAPRHPIGVRRRPPISVRRVTLLGLSRPDEPVKVDSSRCAPAAVYRRRAAAVPRPPRPAARALRRRGCAQLAAHRSLPGDRVLRSAARGAADLRHAVQAGPALRDAHTARFRAKIDCLLRGYVLPHLARHRPNVVVFNEDIGLATLATGSRGGAGARPVHAARRDRLRAARRPVRDARRARGGDRCLRRSRSRPITCASRRSGGLGQGFVAATDTIVRSFMGTFSALAKRYGIYMVGSADVAAVHAVRRSARPDPVRRSGPGRAPSPPCTWPRRPTVYNQVFMWGPRDVRASGPDVLRNVVASNQKVPLTPIEIELGLTPGPARGPAARRQPAAVPAAGHAGADRLRHEPAGVHLRRRRRPASIRARTPARTTCAASTRSGRTS